MEKHRQNLVKNQQKINDLSCGIDMEPFIHRNVVKTPCRNCFQNYFENNFQNYFQHYFRNYFQNYFQNFTGTSLSPPAQSAGGYAGLFEKTWTRSTALGCRQAFRSFSEVCRGFWMFLEVFGGDLGKPPQTSDLRKPPETSDLEVCRGFQRFPCGGFWRFPEVCRGFRRFFEVCGGLRRLPLKPLQTSANLRKPLQTSANLRKSPSPDLQKPPKNLWIASR